MRQEGTGFGLAAGFLKKLPEGVEPPKRYNELKDKLWVEYYQEEDIYFWGYIVVDRQFMPEEERRTFFDEDKE